MPEKKIPLYAANTTVSVEKTEMEIKNLLKLYHADGIAIATLGGQCAIAFVLDDMQVRFTFEEPRLEDFTRTETGRLRPAADRKKAWEQGLRTTWRMMLHRIKDRLIVAYSPFSSLYEEFFFEIVLSDGTTMGQRYPEEQYREMRRQNQLPAFLPGAKLLPPGAE